MTRISELAADSTFDQHAKGSKTPSQQDKMGDTFSDSPKGGSRDARHAYAKQLQLAANSAIRNLQDDSLLANSTWVAPLSAAPGAISVMAFLLTASSNPRVAGLRVGSQAVMNDTNKVEIGKLPSPYIHTNLLHCSDLGRIAFLDAQQRMLKINTSARSMMKEGGKISYMIELLEDPVDASRNLLRAIGDVKSEATDCGQHLAQTKAKFEYWHRVIFKLSEEAADGKNKTEQEHNKIDDITRDATDKQSKLEVAEAAAIAGISDLEDQLQAAKKRTTRAQNELEALLSLPPVREPSYFEQRRQAQDLAPSKPIEKQNIGAIKKSFAWLVGDTKSMRMEKEAHIAAQEEKSAERVKELLDEARSHREREKQEAQAKVNEARARENELYKEHDRLKQKLAKSRELLTNTSFDLAKARSDLAKIGDRKMELTEIIDILRESSKQLGMLKTRLEKLLEFFSALETELTDEALKNVEGFLGAIKDNSTMNGDKIENLDLRKASKKKVLGSALQIQGRFSAIADISEAYVAISQRCIRPMINEMEQLALTKDGEPWQTKCDEFSGKCEQAAAEILKLFTGTREKLHPNMKDRIAMMQRVAIEAAEDNDDSDD